VGLRHQPDQGWLSSVWHLLDATQRNVVRARLNPGEVQWRRGMAWAFEQAMGLVWYYEVSNPLVSLWGRRMLEDGDGHPAAGSLPLAG
jgi:hypothetical protein